MNAVSLVLRRWRLRFQAAESAARQLRQRHCAHQRRRLSAKFRGRDARLSLWYVCLITSFNLASVVPVLQFTRTQCNAGGDVQARHSRAERKARGILENVRVRPTRRTNQVGTHVIRGGEHPGARTRRRTRTHTRARAHTHTHTHTRLVYRLTANNRLC